MNEHYDKEPSRASLKTTDASRLLTVVRQARDRAGRIVDRNWRTTPCAGDSFIIERGRTVRFIRCEKVMTECVSVPERGIIRTIQFKSYLDLCKKGQIVRYAEEACN